MTKTVSARIENQEHEKLIDLANEEGQTVNEYLNDFLNFFKKEIGLLLPTILNFCLATSSSLILKSLFSP